MARFSFLYQLAIPSRKSDAKRSPNSSYSQLSSPSAEYLSDSLPELPALSDFRTSLILPEYVCASSQRLSYLLSLSRRFTILRSSTADFHLIDALKSRLAYQRETGAENHITEEDEDMILDSLGLRAKVWSSAERSEESISTSASSSPSGRKRYSNNLFGSGKFRDYTYIRSVAQSRSSRQSAASKPDDIADTSIQDNGVRSAPLIPSAPYGEQTLSAAEYRLSKTLGPAVFKRASMALEEAIREMEEEAEDQIVMPRSAPMSRTSFDQEVCPLLTHSIHLHIFTAVGTRARHCNIIRQTNSHRARRTPGFTHPIANSTWLHPWDASPDDST